MRYGKRCRLQAEPPAEIVRGRVVALAGRTCTVRGQQGSWRVIVASSQELACGDIVEMLVEPGGVASEVRRLVVPRRNPVGDERSLFQRLQEDEGRRLDLLLLKAKGLQAMREFFNARGFVEWPTPRLVASPGLEIYLQPFVTHYVDGKGTPHRCYLPTSPEFSLKKALCAGMEKIYEICRCFRNGGESGPLHQCEFTMLEWYRAYADYRQIMADLEDLGVTLATTLLAGTKSRFRGREIDWSPPWPRTSLREAFQRYAGIDLGKCLDDREFFRKEAARILGRGLDQDADFEDVFFQVFLEKIEPSLGRCQPEIIYDYPIEMAALAAAKPEEPRFAERFELYVAGVELANAFTELNDPVEQERRFQTALEERRRRGYEPVAVDFQFLAELTYGMPPAGGIALGVERLLMALAGVDTIEDLFFLPHQWEGDQGQRLWPVGGPGPGDGGATPPPAGKGGDGS